MDIRDLKKALETGEMFKDAGKFNEILKKSDGIDELPRSERDKIMDDRDKRREKWNDPDNEEVKEQRDKMIAEDTTMLEKREESQKNEMTLAKIEFLNNEISVYTEHGENLQEKLDENKQKIDDLQNEIDDLKTKIKE